MICLVQTRLQAKILTPLLSQLFFMRKDTALSGHTRQWWPSSCSLPCTWPLRDMICQDTTCHLQADMKGYQGKNVTLTCICKTKCGLTMQHLSHFFKELDQRPDEDWANVMVGGAKRFSSKSSLSHKTETERKLLAHYTDWYELIGRWIILFLVFYQSLRKFIQCTIYQ